MFIEDIILKVTNFNSWVIGTSVSINWAPQDEKFIYSIAEQIAYSKNSLTEKQAIYIVRLLNRNRDQIIPYIPHLDSFLISPKWKDPFRVLPKSKKLDIEKLNDELVITAEFPFDTTIVETLRKQNSTARMFEKGAWSNDVRKWVYPLNENNILKLGDMLLPREFSASDEFLNLYQEAKVIRDDVEKHLPMVVLDDNKYQIKNAHRNIPQPETDNVTTALFHARKYGIHIWDDEIQKQFDDQVKPITKKILLHQSGTNEQLWIDSRVIPLDAFDDLINNSEKILVIIPGGSELEMIKQWNELALRNGLSRERLSVLFRLPNEEADFNKYVKDNLLNNPIDENTKIVFISTKITKPLVKAGLQFDTIFNLGYYSSMHFSVSAVVENVCNLVYYSMKEPNPRRQWQQLR
jgi:hypothetical protein